MKRREPPPLQVTAPAVDLGEVVIRALEDRWNLLRKTFDAARKKAGARRVHDLRVALRRMASVVSLVEEVVDGKAERRLRKRVERLLKMLGRLRDTHVQRKAVVALCRRHPVLEGLADILTRRERAREAEAVRLLGDADIGALQLCFEEVAAETLLALSSPVLARRHRRTLFDAVSRRFSRLIDRRRGLDAADLDTLHDMRVAFKKFRYMVEVLQPVLVGVGRAQLDSMQAFQSMLGDVHDLDVLNRRVARWRDRHEKTSREAVAAHDDIGRRLLQRTESVLAAADEIHAFWSAAYLPDAG